MGGPPDRGEILWLDGGFENFQGLIWCSSLGFFDGGGLLREVALRFFVVLDHEVVVSDVE